MDSAAELGAWPPVLPTLAARETLYSWCATVHRRSVSGNVLVTSRRLFGSNYSGLLHDFPARLGELARRTEGRVGAPRELALKHTLLGYFLPFTGAASGEAYAYGHHTLTPGLGLDDSVQPRSDIQSRMARLAELMSKPLGSKGPPHQRRMASCCSWDGSPTACRKSS